MTPKKLVSWVVGWGTPRRFLKNSSCIPGGLGGRRPACRTAARPRQPNRALPRLGGGGGRGLAAGPRRGVDGLALPRADPVRAGARQEYVAGRPGRGGPALQVPARESGVFMKLAPRGGGGVIGRQGVGYFGPHKFRLRWYSKFNLNICGSVFKPCFYRGQGFNGSMVSIVTSFFCNFSARRPPYLERPYGTFGTRGGGLGWKVGILGIIIQN